MHDSKFCVLRSALATSMSNRGVTAAAAADRAMPFVRPSREKAESQGIVVRVAAVMFALFPKDNTWHGLLMKRTQFSGVHSGQVSIPGGAYEMGDKNLKETAKREFLEEVGIEVSNDSIVGRLTERFIPPSRFAVTPFIAVLSERPNWKIEPKEVASLVEFSLNSLSGEQAMRSVEMEVSPGIRHRMPAYPIGGHDVWGATALILAEFMEHWDNLEEAHRKMP